MSSKDGNLCVTSLILLVSTHSLIFHISLTSSSFFFLDIQMGTQLLLVPSTDASPGMSTTDSDSILGTWHLGEPQPKSQLLKWESQAT